MSRRETASRNLDIPRLADLREQEPEERRVIAPPLLRPVHCASFGLLALCVTDVAVVPAEPMADPTGAGVHLAIQGLLFGEVGPNLPMQADSAFALSEVQGIVRSDPPSCCLPFSADRPSVMPPRYTEVVNGSVQKGIVGNRVSG